MELRELCCARLGSRHSTENSIRYLRGSNLTRSGYRPSGPAQVELLSDCCTLPAMQHVTLPSYSTL